MTSSFANLSVPICQMGIWDMLRSRLYKMLSYVRPSQVLKGQPGFFYLQQHLQAQVLTAAPLIFACRNRLSAKDQGWSPRGTGGVSAALPTRPPTNRHMCSFLRGTFTSVLSQDAFDGSLFLFLVPFTLIFIRKPVCGLPLSITQLLLLEFKHVYLPTRLAVFLLL